MSVLEEHSKRFAIWRKNAEDELAGKIALLAKKQEEEVLRALGITG